MINAMRKIAPVIPSGRCQNDLFLKTYFSNVSTKPIPVPRSKIVEPALGGEKRMVVEDNVLIKKNTFSSF